MRSATTAEKATSSRQRALVALTLLVSFILQVTYSSIAAIGSKASLSSTWPTIPAALGMILVCGICLLGGRFTLRAIALSSAIGALQFVVLYALIAEVAGPGSSNFFYSVSTRVLYSFILTADVLVAFVICMIAGAVIRLIRLDPARKNQRYR